MYAMDPESRTPEIHSPSLSLSFLGLTTLSSSDTGGHGAVWQRGQWGGVAGGAPLSRVAGTQPKQSGGFPSNLSVSGLAPAALMSLRMIKLDLFPPPPPVPYLSLDLHKHSLGLMGEAVCTM